MTIERVDCWKAHGGTQGVYRHDSRATGTPMTFSVFVPEHSEGQLLPVLWYLSGLTCTHANVTEKGEYRAACAEQGIIFVAPDTSPRGEGVADDDGYDLGQGAGFYVDATEAPWATHFRMWTYVAEELPQLVAAHFPIDLHAQGVTGHSMGGHGALTLALRQPERFRSVSAFAPITHPSDVPWGRKALSAYLGDDVSSWRNHDTVALIEDGARCADMLVDVGADDPFYDEQLKPATLEAACAKAGQPLTLRRQAGYDHSYYFISSFMADHVRWHASRLKG